MVPGGQNGWDHRFKEISQHTAFNDEPLAFPWARSTSVEPYGGFAGSELLSGATDGHL